MPPSLKKEASPGLSAPSGLRQSAPNLDAMLCQGCGAEEEMRCFFNNSHAMLCIAGSDGYFKRLSLAWTTTLGWSLEELQSKPFLEFVHPDDHTATLAEMEGLLDGGRTILFENRYRCQDGSYKWLEWNATGLCLRQLIFAIARDTTSSRGLEQEILAASDREKERLGRELHDGLCQNLAGIAALSTTLSRRLEANSELAVPEAREITKLLNETIGQARDMARGLNPVNLEQIGVAAALEAFTSNVEGLFGISCRFRTHPRLPNLNSEVGLHLFRIAQEAVNNAITHGRARQIDVALGFQGEKGLLSIQDDGRGINEEALIGLGLGAHTMNYRSRLIGGALKMQRGSLGGTNITCLFPLPPQELTP